MQLNKRSGQPEAKPKREAREYESAEGKQTNLTTGRLNMKIGGQEHEVERPFTSGNPAMGMTMQVFKPGANLEDTLKTAKIAAKMNSNEEEQARNDTKAKLKTFATDDNQTPAQAYDRNLDKN